MSENTPNPPGKPGFAIHAAGRVANIYIYQPISRNDLEGLTSDAFRRELEAAGEIDLIRLYVDCPGGDVMAGWAIHQCLTRHPARINAIIDGWCASMATLIVCAADRIEMHEGAMFMIHAPYDANAKEQPPQQDLELLKQIKETMISTYANKTGLSPLKLRNMMTAEGTYMTATEAKRLGFVDHVISLRVAACAWDLKAFGLTPPNVEPAAEASPEPMPGPSLRDQIANSKIDQLKSRGILRTTTPTKGT